MTSFLFEVSVNNENLHRPFDLSDRSQAPNLAFLDFKPKSRAQVEREFSWLYGGANATPFQGAGAADIKAFKKLRDRFISTWVDQYIKEGKLEVLEDGTLRRATKPTMVHYDVPDDTDESEPDPIPQSEYTPEFRASLLERWAPFKRVEQRGRNPESYARTAEASWD